LALSIGPIFVYQLFMRSSISDTQKKRGRPATGITPPFNIRLSAEIRDRIDAWIAGQSDPSITRAEAVRRLVEKGLGETGTPSAITPNKLNASNDE
jgi:hypothetical protein